MKTILLGYGNVGKALHELLTEKNVKVDFIVRSSGIFSGAGARMGEVDMFDTLVDNDTTVYVSLPSDAHANKHLHYYLRTLEVGGYLITCEKSVLAHYWHILMPYRNHLFYSATVGGNSGILPALHQYPEKIEDIKSVVNGTLNYISEESLKGKSKEEMYQEVTRLGYAEPGSNNFEEVIAAEMQDVLYKAVILANHAGIYEKIITKDDIMFEPFREGGRCMIVADRHHIRAGFMYDEPSWFPSASNTVLLVNGKKIAEGPGAGGRITAERMYTDSLSII